MSAKETSYHHGNLKTALIDAGVHILAKEGTSALSLRRVAREAGVSHNAPYSHFADKESLLSAIAKEGFLKLSEMMQNVNSNTPEGSLKQLKSLGKVYVEFALSHPQHFQLMFAELPLETHVSLGKTAYGTFECLENTIIACQQKENIKQGDSTLLAMNIWTTAHGLATLLVQGRANSMKADLSTEELSEQLLNNLLEGMKS